ncbi:MAG: KH domain-containing protein [Cyanobacteria bacterium SBLK]|nr:KH domain-containing protein [Cyanobacteria bacterium SBLK]
MPEPITYTQTSSQADRPNYEKLVRFLIEPLLDSPSSLSIHCEVARSNERVLVRVAFDGDEQGRVFGRGGRNIDAIRTTLEAAALASGQSVRLEIYGESERDYNSNGSRYNNYEDGDRRRFKKPYTVRPPAPTRRHSFRRKRSSESRANWRSGNDEW